jgi:hypothetical protein
LPVLQAQVVDELIDPVSLEITGGQVLVVFDDARSNADPSKTNFEVQHSSDISRWTGMPTAIVSNDGNRYTLTADEPAGEDRKFYRVIRYSTTAEDSDGDGLSDDFETSESRPAAERTDPTKVDSDFDGFSDSIEFAAFKSGRAAANNPLVFPKRAELPSVQFVEALSSATEGQSPVPMISLVVDGPVSGTLSVAYSVNARSTATAPEDFTALSGTADVTVSGGSISIPLVDDLEISAERIIILDLAPNGGTNYRTGGRTTHVVCLSENDCCWSGVLKDTFATRNFRMKLLRDDSVTQAAFIAGSEDGLLKPDGNASSQSEGVIPITPKEIWNATV